MMNASPQPESRCIGLPPEQFAAAFPFHFALGLDMKFLQAGSSLHRLCPDVQPGVPLNQIFDPIRPQGKISLDWVQNNNTRFFLLEHRLKKLLLRGEFMLLPDRNMLVFLGSPWFTDSSEIVALGINLEDFAIHDPVADMLQVFQANKMALEDAKKLAAKLTTQRAELRQVNERLLQQEAETRKLALIAERTDNAVVLTDAAGRIVWVNEGFTRITGYTLSEVLGRKPGDVLQGPETDPSTVQHAREQLRKGEGFNIEILNYGKNGRKYWLAIEVQPILDDSGQIDNYMAIERDITERKLAEAALQAEVARRRMLFEQSADGIVIIDPQTARFVEFNTAAHELLGYTREEFAHLSLSDVEALETNEETKARIAHVIEKGRADFETLQRTRHGDVRNVQITAQIVLVEGQTVYQCLWRDITERKSAEEKLRQLSRAVEQCPVSIVITNPAGVIEYVNPQCLETTGYTQAELLGRNPRVLKSGEATLETYRELWETITAGKEWHGEFHNKKKNGELYWEYAFISPIRDAAGHITHFLAIKEDITERKKSEALLLQANALQRAMLEGAGYAIIATDPQGVIKLFNPAAERMLGYSAAELVGKQSPGVFHLAEEISARARALTAELGREVKAGFEAFVAKSELGQPDQREWSYVRKDGAVFPVLLSVTTLFDDRGAITGYLGIASDLTARKRDEEQLRVTLAELERLNRVMMKREDRVLEMKREINQMLAATGLPPAYPAASENSVIHAKTS